MSAERKAARAQRRASRALERAQKAAHDARRLEEAAGRRAGRERGRGRPLLLASLAVLSVAGGAAATVVVGAGGVEQALVEIGIREEARDPLVDEVPEVAVEEVDDLGEVVRLRKGRIDLLDLAGHEALAGHGDAFEVDGRDVLVNLPVRVEPGATLVVRGSTVRLRSDDDVTAALIGAGGSLEVTASTISSWDGDAGEPDRDVADGRAYLLVDGGGSLSMQEVVLRDLGADGPGRWGVTLAGETSLGTLRDVRVDGGFAGVVVQGAREVQLDQLAVTEPMTNGVEIVSASGVELGRTVVSGADGDGVLISGSSTDVELRDLDVVGSRGAGVAVQGAAGGVRLTELRVHSNGGAGVALQRSMGVRIEDSLLWGNRAGIELLGVTSEVLIEGNRLSGNRGAGLESTAAGATAALVGNRVEHNDAGVRVVDGSVSISRNVMRDNGIGVEVLDTTPTTSVLDNVIEDSADVGVLFVEGDGLQVQGNRIGPNFNAAFAVPELLASEAFAGNDLAVGRLGHERLVEPERAVAVAEVAPPPQFFFITRDQRPVELPDSVRSPVR